MEGKRKQKKGYEARNNESKRFAAGILQCLTIILSLTVLAQAVPLNMFTRRSIRLGANTGSDAKTNETIDILQRASKAGYNLIRLECSQFPTIYKTGAPRMRRLKKIFNECNQLGVYPMLATFHQAEPVYAGIQNSEALPVKATKFVVSGNTARAIDDGAYTFQNAGFEQWQGDAVKTPQAWRLSKLGPGKHVFVDNAVKHSGNSSVRVEIPNDRAEALHQKVTVKKWRAYRLSAWIKTEKVLKPHGIGFEVLAGNRYLLCPRGHRGVSSTQNWKKHSWEFCSLEATSLKIRLALSWAKSTTGTVWFDNLEIHEIGLQEVVNRSTLKTVVRSESGKVYQSGKDYTIGKEQLMIPAGSSIRNGDVLRVDWFRMADMDCQPGTASFCHKEAWDTERKIVSTLCDSLGPVYGWFIKFCEWRIAGWDPACQARHATGGDYIGWVANESMKILRGYNDKMEIHIGNATFDPYHNAKDNYYMVRGTAKGSWTNLDPNAIICNWNGKNMDRSVPFFMGKDPAYPTMRRRQTFSALNGNVDRWLQLLDKMEAQYGEDARDIAVGVQYAEYGTGFDRIELLADKCQKAGRWASNKCPFENGCDYTPEINTVGKQPQSGLSMAVSTASFAKQTKIEYALSSKSDIIISITNALGQEVFRSNPKTLSAGTHTFVWRGRSPAGVYFVNLRATGPQGGSLTKKIIRL